MKLWDLGGQAKFRDSWEKFCRDSDVIIFVVDSYDQSNNANIQPISTWPELNSTNCSATRVSLAFRCSSLPTKTISKAHLLRKK